jgi:Ca2+-binding RTX toxin-like protein
MTISIGTADHDVITGTASADELFGLGGDDSLEGGGGDDLLDGGSGADAMAGGAGDDAYIVDDWSDVITEAADDGIDEARTSLFLFSLPDNVENLVGTSHDVQWLYGNSADNELWAGSGGGGIIGGDGDDILHHNSAGGHVSGGNGYDICILAGTLADYVITRSGYVFPDDERLQVYNIALGTTSPMTEIELFVFEGDGASYTIAALFDRHGTAGDDEVTGDDSMNFLYGLEGNDIILGLGGSDWIDGGAGADTMIGGNGEDVYIVDDSSDLIVEEANAGFENVRIYASYYTLSANVENGWAFSTAATRLIGNAGSNRLVGNAGDDVLEGRGGDDVLEGRGGTDTMIGGAGNDLYLVEEHDDVIVETAGGGIDMVGTTLAFYALPAFVEDVAVWWAGTARTVIGNGLANRFELGPDPTRVEGCGGIDTADYGYVYNWLLADLLTGEMGGEAAGDELIGIENLTGGGGDDVLRGTHGANVINGMPGNDIMVGRGGNDIYHVHEQADIVIEAAGEGTDEIRIQTWIDEYTLPDHVENLRNLSPDPFIGYGNALNNEMTGAAAEDTFFGGDGHDMLSGGGGDDVLLGEAGHDMLSGGAGADTLYGGDGNDAFLVDDPKDIVVERPGEGIDTVYASTQSYTLPDEIENLSANARGGFTGIGNDSANLIHGGGSADLLVGAGGDDELRGQSGADILDGGDGSDLLSGGHGGDVLAGGAGSDAFLFNYYDTGTGGDADRILDFVSGEDTIRLSAIDADSATPGDQQFTFVGAAAFSGAAGELRTSFDGADTWLQADTNGDGVADFEIVLSGAVILVVTDFLL